MVDRLKDITRNFPVALELGTRRGHVLNELLIASDENYDEEVTKDISITLLAALCIDLSYDISTYYYTYS